jgi:hypothetical protein
MAKNERKEIDFVYYNYSLILTNCYAYDKLRLKLDLSLWKQGLFVVNK